MAQYPALPLFTDAYLSDTRHLTAAQHGAYLLLLMMAWRTPDCSLPNDDNTLAKWACMDKRTWANNKETILSFWRLGCDQKFRQGRLCDERKYVEYKSSINSSNAKSKSLKTKDRHRADAKRTPSEIEAPTPTPTPTPKEIYTGNLEGFHEFWRHYPKQRAGSKDKALAAWTKACKRHSAELVLAGCMAYAASDEVAKGFAKGCAAWLNDERYLNDYSHKKGDNKNDKQSNTIRSIKALGFGNEPQRENYQDIPNQLLLSTQRIRQDT